MRTVFTGLLFLGTAGTLFCQQGDLPERILSFYAPFIVPKIFQDVDRLRSFITGEEFASARMRRGDVSAVDMIFSEAMELTWDNCYEALLISTAATMDHRRVGIRLPLVGPLLWLPLTSEFPGEFEERMGRLPAKLYPDSPADPGGDRDKLQHFFGSAFIAFSFESRESAEQVGQMIELGEDRFIVDGKADPRDLRANHQGRSFGLALLNDPSVVPSDFLQIVTASSPERADSDQVVRRWCSPLCGDTGDIKEAR